MSDLVALCQYDCYFLHLFIFPFSFNELRCSLDLFLKLPAIKTMVLPIDELEICPIQPPSIVWRIEFKCINVYKKIWINFHVYFNSVPFL